MVTCEVINLWTCPRSMSTCLMYSFAQRDDTEALDEPFFAPLAVNSEEQQFRAAVTDSMETDGNKVIDTILGPCEKKYRFVKNMASYLYVQGLKKDILIKACDKHVILLKDPIKSLPSMSQLRQVLEMAPIVEGLQIWSPLLRMYNELRQARKRIIVVDADDLQRDPKGVLQALCKALEMEFQPAMLSWKSGPKEMDIHKKGYETVHSSTGFLPPSDYPTKPFPPQCHDLEECWALYMIFKHHAIKTLETLDISKPSYPKFAWLDDRLVPFGQVKVLIPQSALKEELQVHKGKVCKMGEHVNRFLDKAKVLVPLNHVPSHELVKRAVFSTLIINGMYDNIQVVILLLHGEQLLTSEFGSSFIVFAKHQPISSLRDPDVSDFEDEPVPFQQPLAV